MSEVFPQIFVCHSKILKPVNDKSMKNRMPCVRICFREYCGGNSQSKTRDLRSYRQ